MARRFRGRRILLFAAIIVALSIGIVFASIPYLPHPPSTLQQAETHDIPGGSTDNPGSYALTLSGIPGGQKFAVGVLVTNGTAIFCVMQQAYYLSWQLNPGTPFPYSNCIPPTPEPAIQATLAFTPPSTGNWDVVALNTNPGGITVQFSPV